MTAAYLNAIQKGLRFRNHGMTPDGLLAFQVEKGTLIARCWVSTKSSAAEIIAYGHKCIAAVEESFR